MLGVIGALGIAVLVFVLALSLVTGIEAVAGRPLSGGDLATARSGACCTPQSDHWVMSSAERKV